MSPIANSSEEYWSIDNVSLHQYGWSVATVGGSRYDLPPRRGENIRFAYRPGAIHRPKLADSRTIDLVMWVAGIDPATGASVTDPMVRWNDSWDYIRRLVWKASGTQVTLTRRWKLTVSGTPTLVAADALAEITDTMAPSMTGRFRAEFSMQLLLADPYFYGTQVTTNLSPSTPVTINNPGHDVAAFGNFELDFIGPLTNPRLTNTTPTPDCWVQYNGTISSGQTVRLKVSDFQANLVSSGANHIAKINHYGARYWMGLLPGDNNVVLTADSGSGSAQLRYRPPYV